jgi:hypothetical protein
MLTLFTTAKPFRGHIAVIQRNALKSWTLLHPDVEIIVFGDDEGSGEICAEFGLRHEPSVARTESGAIRLDDMFQKAQTLARYQTIAYANCDILLMSDFLRAIERVKCILPEFLMVGQRWDFDLTERIDFSSPSWQQRVRALAFNANQQQGPWSIDYFAFVRGLYASGIPPMAIGRLWWDDWLIWKALVSGRPVVDASASVLAAHQNHDYGHNPQGRRGIWEGPEQKRNMDLAGGPQHLRTIEDATFLLKTEGLQRNWGRYILALQRSSRGKLFLTHVFYPVWFFLLGITRPLRTALGFRSDFQKPFRGDPGIPQ